MLEELTSVLRLFLSEDVRLLRRGHRRILDRETEIPVSWMHALYSESPVTDSILRIWSPISGYMDRALETLVNYTIDIALVVSSDAASPPRLLYIFQGTTRAAFGWLGSQPATDEDIARNELRLETRLPRSYELFSRVHNGFVLDGLSTVGPRSLDGLFLLSELPGAESTHGDANKLLAFSGDGAGNEQCYDLACSIEGGDYATVDWDHESRELSNPMTFWEYLDELVYRREEL